MSMARTDDDRLLHIARKNKWTLCYLACISTAILLINIYYMVKGH